MGRPRNDQPRVTTERVLEAAAHLFRERGYEKTSLNTIGERLGVSGAALYHHFRSKDDVLFTYLETGLQEVLERTEEALDGASATERMRQLVRTYVLFDLAALPGSQVWAAGTYGFYQLVESLEPGQRRRLAKLQRSYLDLIRSIIKDGVAGGEFETVDVTAAAFAIVGMGSHAIHWFRAGEKLTADDVADLHASLVLRMLQSRAR